MSPHSLCISTPSRNRSGEICFLGARPDFVETELVTFHPGDTVQRVEGVGQPSSVACHVAADRAQIRFAIGVS